MRGQRLFIRRIESGDAASLGDFLRAQGCHDSVPARGVLGKLVGNLVAVMAIEVVADAVRIDGIVVERELRRKRIGRLLLDELARMAPELGARRLTVADALPERGFFLRCGFADENGMLVRRV